MVLTDDELKEVLKELIRCNIDLNQAVNYFLNSNYTAGRKNILDVLENLTKINQAVSS